MKTTNDSKFQVQIRQTSYANGRVRPYGKGLCLDFSTLDAAHEAAERLFCTHNSGRWALSGVRIMDRSAHKVLWEVNC